MSEKTNSTADKWELRPYQKECTEVLDNCEGNHLVAIATGLGKTVIFTHLKRQGRTLILSHRDELVRQPEKYYEGKCSFGVEKAEEHAEDEDVVSASVQSLSRPNRLERYSPDAFDTIIIDEAHHAAAETYKRVLDYFSGARRRIGFTATPQRGDGVRLTDVFDDIIFKRDLKWGIENGYLSRIRCEQVGANYKLAGIKKVAGDYSAIQLEEVLKNSETIPLAAKTYVERCHKQKRHTIIYCVTKKLCYVLESTIRELLPEDERNQVCVLTGDTPDDVRKDMLAKFQSGEIMCLINCMVLTEGTDLPVCDAIINLRPTCSNSLYQQMAGRGTRLYEGKEYCLLIDVTPDDGCTRSLCTAPSLFGIEMSLLSQKQKAKLTEDMDLLDFCDSLAGQFADESKQIELLVQTVDRFIEERTELLDKNQGQSIRKLAADYTEFRSSHLEEGGDYDFGELDVEVQADEKHYYKITPTWSEAVYISKPDVLDEVTVEFTGVPTNGFRSGVFIGQMRMNEAIKLVRKYCELQANFYEYAWNKKTQDIWKKMKATDNQVKKLNSVYKKSGISMSDSKELSKLDASKLIDMSMSLKEAQEQSKLYKDARSGKNTKKALLAKEQVERELKEDKAARQRGEQGFGTFRKQIEKDYKKLEAERQKSLLPPGKDEAVLTVNPKMYPAEGRAASDKQIVFASNLAAQVAGMNYDLGDLNYRSMTMRQVSVLIELLLYIVNNCNATAQRIVFPDVEQTCRNAETEYDPLKGIAFRFCKGE